MCHGTGTLTETSLGRRALRVLGAGPLICTRKRKLGLKINTFCDTFYILSKISARALLSTLLNAIHKRTCLDYWFLILCWHPNWIISSHKNFHVGNSWTTINRDWRWENGLRSPEFSTISVYYRSAQYQKTTGERGGGAWFSKWDGPKTTQSYSVLVHYGMLPMSGTTSSRADHLCSPLLSSSNWMSSTLSHSAVSQFN